MRLMVCAVATDEILGFHFVRLMVFAWPASDRFLPPQIVTSVVLTGPATDEIVEPQFERFCGGCWAWLGLPQVKFWHSRGHG